MTVGIEPEVDEATKLESASRMRFKAAFAVLRMDTASKREGAKLTNSYWTYCRKSLLVWRTARFLLSICCSLTTSGSFRTLIVERMTANGRTLLLLCSFRSAKMCLIISFCCCDPTETALSQSMLLSVSTPVNIHTSLSVYSNGLWDLSHPHRCFRSVSSRVTLACLSSAWSLCSECWSDVSQWVPANSSRASHMGIHNGTARTNCPGVLLLICRPLVSPPFFSSPSSKLFDSHVWPDSRPKLTCAADCEVVIVRKKIAVFKWHLFFQIFHSL